MIRLENDYTTLERTIKPTRYENDYTTLHLPMGLRYMNMQPL
jgi:hypothetical protein